MINRKSVFSNFSLRLRNLFARIVDYLLLILIAVLAVSLVRNIIETHSTDQEIKREEGKVKELQEKQKELEEKLAMTKSQEYIEKQLRDKLGLVRDKEIVVILPDTEVVKRFAPKTKEEEKILPDPIWKKWAKLFRFLD